ncbi:hypothetical protein J6590_030829 [Homalodisca vitripennis]|nr:hypothetical protein J6590_030829 [Homalodisca vitripennis]
MHIRVSRGRTAKLLDLEGTQPPGVTSLRQLNLCSSNQPLAETRLQQLPTIGITSPQQLPTFGSYQRPGVPASEISQQLSYQPPGVPCHYQLTMLNIEAFSSRVDSAFGNYQPAAVTSLQQLPASWIYQPAVVTSLRHLKNSENYQSPAVTNLRELLASSPAVTDSRSYQHSVVISLGVTSLRELTAFGSYQPPPGRRVACLAAVSCQLSSLLSVDISATQTTDNTSCRNVSVYCCSSYPRQDKK